MQMNNPILNNNMNGMHQMPGPMNGMHMGAPGNAMMANPGMNPMLGMMNNNGPAGVPRPGQQGRASDECTLYVGGLSHNTDDNRLFTVFSQYGNVTSARILKDSYTGLPRGFGFVGFKSKNGAANAIKNLKFTLLDNSMLNINWKNNNPKNFPKDANLYIKNLDKEVTEKDLNDTLSEFGTIASVLIRRDPKGKSIGYGYVQFKKSEDAQKCIAEANNLKLGENNINIEVFKPRGKRGVISSKNNLYVHTFPEKLKTKEEITTFLKNIFENYGEIVSLFIKKSEKHGKFFSFVAFKTPEMAASAIGELSDNEINSDGEKLYISYAATKEQRRKEISKNAKNDKNFYMRSIASNVTEEQVRKVFSKYGKLGSIKLVEHKFNAKNDNGSAAKPNMQYGFICFEDAAEASAAFAIVKEDEEVKALLDANHKAGTDFFFYHQNKGVRSSYNKMSRKNNQTTGMYSKQMNHMIKNMMKMMRANQNAQGMRGGMNMNNMGNMNNMKVMQQMMMSMNPMMMRQQQMQAQQAQMMASQQQNQQLVQQQQQQANQPKDVNWLKANLDAFNGYKNQEKKNLLGTMMYNQVAKYSPEQFVPKITGMLIDLEVLGVNEIVEILDNPEVLKERIAEAIKIIEEDNEGQM